jgi:hypothetical protein
MTLSGWNPPPQGPGYGGPQPPQQPYGQQPQPPYGQQPYGQPGQPYGPQTPPPFGQTPPPFGQQAPPPFGQGQPGYPPNPHRSKTGLILGLAGAGVVVLILVVVLVVSLSGGGGVGGGDKYVVSTPPSAGGYPQVASSEDDAFGNSFRSLLGSKGTVVSATYDVNGTKVAFTGVSGTDMGDENGFRQGLENSGSAASVTFHDTSPGGPGTGGCAEITAATLTIPLCYWQTGTSLGMVIANPDLVNANPQNMSWSQLADVMRKMRPDLEKPA